MPFGRLAGLWLRVDGLNAHLAHQATNPLVIDLIALSLQAVGHPTPAVEGPFHVLNVDKPHQMEIEFCLRCRFIVEGGAVESYQLALTSDTQIWMTQLNQLAFGVTRMG